MTKRQRYKEGSNNKKNPNQNICIQAVVKYFKCEDDSRYLHTTNDVIYAIRKRHTVRSRGSKVIGLTVGKARLKLAKNSLKEEFKVLGYYIEVIGHGILLDSEGNTIVDTAPSKRDKRKICECYIIY